MSYTIKQFNKGNNMINQIIIFVLIIIGLFVSADYINAWEVANSYPFGMLCEVYNSCK